MTFEEWWGVQEELDRNPANEAFAKPVWDAAWAEGLAEGYDVGYDDTGICPECLNEVKHKKAKAYD